MKTYYTIKKSFVVVIACAIVGCGAETVAAIVFIPAFAATWPVIGIDEYAINLQPDPDNRGVVSGVFVGNEFNRPDDPNADNPLTGSFNGLNIEFTIIREDGNIHYTGIMTPTSLTDHTIKRIDLESSEGTLVLGFD